MLDEVTLKPDLANCAADYARRCESIGNERREVIDLQHAMNHPSFKVRHHALLDELAKEYRNSLSLLERSARFTVKLGVYGTKDSMLASLKDKGHIVSDHAQSVIKNDQLLMLETPEEYEFLETTVKELTGKGSPTTTELYEAMYRLGFIDAPHESAPAIREIYDDQPMDEWRAVLSKPVAGSDGYLHVLYMVRNSRGSWVDGCRSDPGDQWRGGVRLLVCRKRQLAA